MCTYQLIFFLLVKIKKEEFHFIVCGFNIMLIGSNLNSDFGPLPSSHWSMDPPRLPINSSVTLPQAATMQLSPTGKFNFQSNQINYCQNKSIVHFPWNNSSTESNFFDKLPNKMENFLNQTIFQRHKKIKTFQTIETKKMVNSIVLKSLNLKIKNENRLKSNNFLNNFLIVMILVFSWNIVSL